MATSGSTDFNATRDDIINRALRIVGLTAVGNTVPANDVSNAAEALEMMVKSLQTQGVRLWTRDWITSPRKGTGSEVTNGGSNWTCIRPHTSDSSNEPGVGADSASYWVIRGTSGSAWSTSTAYTAANTFSLPAGYIQVDEAWVRQSGTDTPLQRLSFEDYLNIYQKDSTGRATVYAVQETNSVPTVYIYPFPDATEIIINMLAVRVLEDFDAAGNNPDFPVEWLNMLVWGLADELADEYHLPLPERERISRKAHMYRTHAKRDDTQDYQRIIESCY